MLNGKFTKSLIVLVVILTSTLFNMNISLVNAVDKVTYGSNIYYVTEQTGDAYYLNGYEFRNNSSLGYLKSDVYDTFSGFKFTDVILSNTSTIDHAYLSLYSSDGIDNFDYMVTIYGNDVDSGSDFDFSAQLTNAILTSSYSGWNMKDLEGNQWRNSTDIKNSIQEIINRGGWISGNNVTLILYGAISANGYRSFRTWDYDVGHTYRAKLYVEYHVTSAVTSTNPWDSIDGWDNHILINETNGYIWWEVWNGTSSIFNFAYDAFYWGNGTYISNMTTNYVAGYGAHSNFDLVKDVYNNGTLYCVAYHTVATTGFNIMKSNDNGVTWTVYTAFGKWIANCQSAFTWMDDVIIEYFVDTNYDVKYRLSIYNITSKTYLDNTENWAANSGYQINNVYYHAPTNEIYCTVSSASSGCSIKSYSLATLAVTSSTTIDATANYGGYAGVMPDKTRNDTLLITYCNTNAHDLYYQTYNTTTHAIITGRTQYTTELLSYSRCNYVSYNNSHAFFTYIEPSTGFEQHIVSWNSAEGFDDNIVGLGVTQYDLVMTCINSDGSLYYNKGDNTGVMENQDSIHVHTGTNAYNLPNYQSRVGATSTHYYILTDPDGNIVIDGIIPDFPPSPLLLNTTIDSWLFKGEVYEFETISNNTNEAEFNLTDGYHTMIFYYNNLTTPITQNVYTLDADGTLINEDVIGGISVSHLIISNTTYLTWKFILGINVIDILNTTITYRLVSWNTTTLLSLSISGITNSTVNIYNLGGRAEYQFAGDGSHVVGGHPFELEATNSSLVVGGSYAESWLVYRRLQYIHLLAELDMDNEVEAVEHFEPLVNIGYAEYGIDYKLEGEESNAWIEGWKCRIYAQEINVGTYGLGNDMAYVKMYVFWYNRGDFVGGNEFYTYHNGYDKDSFPTNRRTFTFWVDLWFDKTNSSTVFGGRVNAEYYGYYEAGSAWWFTSAFRPMIANQTTSMFLGNIKDADGNIVQSKKISLVRVITKVAKTASGMGGLGDVNTYKLRPYEILEVNLATDRMEGINTPPIIETAYLDIGGYGIWGFLISALNGLGDGFFNLTKLFLSAADTVLSWFGLPFGTFSNIITFLSILPTMLINLANIIYQMFTSVITVIISGSSLFIMTIIGWVSVMLSTINLISNFINIFISLFTGGYGTGVNIWVYYNVAEFLSLIMLLLPLMWFQRLARSEHPLSTIGGDIDLIKTFATSMIGFFDWLFDKVLYIAQMFLSLIRG